MQNRVQKKKKISLTTMIFIALLAGALAGVIINYVIPSNYVVDDIIVQSKNTQITSLIFKKN